MCVCVHILLRVKCKGEHKCTFDCYTRCMQLNRQFHTQNWITFFCTFFSKQSKVYFNTLAVFFFSFFLNAFITVICKGVMFLCVCMFSVHSLNTTLTLIALHIVDRYSRFSCFQLPFHSLFHALRLCPEALNHFDIETR